MAKTANSTMTRRQALAGTAGAAAIVAGTPAIAADDQDRAEWLALWLDFMRKERALEELPDDHTQADEDRVNEARWAAGSLIEETPATTLAGLAVKLAYAMYWDPQERTDADINAQGFGGNNYTGLVAVYQDAMELAGFPDDLWRCAWVDCGPIT